MREPDHPTINPTASAGRASISVLNKIISEENDHRQISHRYECSSGLRTSTHSCQTRNQAFPFASPPTPATLNIATPKQQGAPHILTLRPVSNARTRASMCTHGATLRVLDHLLRPKESFHACKLTEEKQEKDEGKSTHKGLSRKKAKL